MEAFNYRDGELFAEGVALSALAQRFGTPTYVYSRAHIEGQYRAYADALSGMPHLVCFAVKANSNIGVLNVLARLGAGFDIVSSGELERVLAAGGDPSRIVFSGVGKSRDDMRRALEVGVHCFNVESSVELERLQKVAAELDVKAPVSLRVNPDVDAGTHPYISTGLKENKFGIDIEQAEAVYARAAELPNLEVIGVDCHIGSQLTTLEPFLDALDRLLLLVDRLAARGITIRHLDLGGGLGVQYRDEQPPLAGDYIAAVRKRLTGRDLSLVFEPGRFIVANAGVLLTQVEYLKHTEHKDFAIIDAAMNDLIRPALYQAWMDVSAVQPRAGEARNYDLVGPICETGDFLAKDRQLVLAEGDLLAVRSAGAYGFVMSSNYNTRGRAAEVLVDGEQAFEVRRRETVQELYAGESLLPA
ncbi:MULTISPECIES: diaminopimelate decarboxylase [Pseudomonas]|uniref:diaminopimelate decarboxylase n=1 Tax=Pseudomonadaceae TaxID=135621 RepID=UPI00106ED8D1|nr:MULTISPECIES: diaminopimelate decarboxylase [Pseudomonas]TNF07612.1 MAG: diaminopimelate decarboxylase [Pseudomonadales bacterium]HIQ45144.1 diaminopimelate decarboxylase [Pseudomonas oleovorans]QFT20209.1 Diaminopimelate decarboxylase [Pseudomonas sp. THAF187a]QFT40400.1 Diaminopimelate decarboxylase [Pseudomonas sp. THAF42]QTS86815.1 diaminopimelate decarboxylase [Pseudomonas khazarica]|tara:strand:- start:21518 stop:22765 length:1248 start_codon:yes stop_codon:yes gene_type:complete